MAWDSNRETNCKIIVLYTKAGGRQYPWDLRVVVDNGLMVIRDDPAMRQPQQPWAYQFHLTPNSLNPFCSPAWARGASAFSRYIL